MKISSYIVTLSLSALILTSSGCGFSKPRPRLGCYPTSTPGTKFVSADHLGKHSYFYSPFENNGIAYTRKAGHIDITHLRIAADHTRYLYHKLYKTLMKDDPNFSFSLTVDKSTHHVTIEYPQNWNHLKESQKNQVAQNVSLQLSQYLAYSATTWHEILTWFGYRSMGLFSEFPSAFSWEDTYSNLLGTRLAAQALQNKKLSYNQAMTLALNRQIKYLDGLPAGDAKKASQNVRGKWFQGNIFVQMKKRNIDIGLDNGYVTPMLIPELSPSTYPVAYPAPNSDVSKFGFSIDYYITPREFEKDKICRIVHPTGDCKTIDPMTDYKTIMTHIKNTAVKMYGTQVATAYFPQKIQPQKTTTITKSTLISRNNSNRNQSQTKTTLVSRNVSNLNKSQTKIEQSLQNLLTLL